MPAQKIALEANERTALLVAKNFPPRWRAHPSDRLDKVTGLRKLNINSPRMCGHEVLRRTRSGSPSFSAVPVSFQQPAYPMTSASKKNVMPARRPFVP
jgi:hypothetical protein